MEPREPGHQVQRVAERTPRGQDEQEGEGENDPVGDGLGDGGGHPGGGVGGHGGHAVFHSPVHGIHQLLIKAHLPQGVQHVPHGELDFCGGPAGGLSGLMKLLLQLRLYGAGQPGLDGTGHGGGKGVGGKAGPDKGYQDGNEAAEREDKAFGSPSPHEEGDDQQDQKIKNEIRHGNLRNETRGGWNGQLGT